MVCWILKGGSKRERCGFGLWVISVCYIEGVKREIFSLIEKVC